MMPTVTQSVSVTASNAYIQPCCNSPLCQQAAGLYRQLDYCKSLLHTHTCLSLQASVHLTQLNSSCAKSQAMATASCQTRATPPRLADADLPPAAASAKQWQAVKAKMSSGSMADRSLCQQRTPKTSSPLPNRGPPACPVPHRASLRIVTPSTSPCPSTCRLW